MRYSTASPHFQRSIDYSSNKTVTCMPASASNDVCPRFRKYLGGEHDSQNRSTALFGTGRRSFLISFFPSLFFFSSAYHIIRNRALKHRSRGPRVKYYATDGMCSKLLPVQYNTKQAPLTPHPYPHQKPQTHTTPKLKKT